MKYGVRIFPIVITYILSFLKIDQFIQKLNVGTRGDLIKPFRSTSFIRGYEG